MEDQRVYKLSEMFSHKMENPELELTVRVININEGYDEGYDTGYDDGIKDAVKIMRSLGMDDSVIAIKLCEQYGLSNEMAKKYL